MQRRLRGGITPGFPSPQRRDRRRLRRWIPPPAATPAPPDRRRRAWPATPQNDPGSPIRPHFQALAVFHRGSRIRCCTARRVSLYGCPPQTGRPPRPHRNGGRVAQLVEQLTLNQRVTGSIPVAPTTSLSKISSIFQAPPTRHRTRVAAIGNSVGRLARRWFRFRLQNCDLGAGRQLVQGADVQAPFPPSSGADPE